MVGAGLQKLARNNGLVVDSGVAYGNLRGFATTLSEGAGYKRIDIVTAFPTPENKSAFLNAVEAVPVSKEYRVLKVNITPWGFSVMFHDTVGTMKRINAFIDWFYPLLEANEAQKATVCSRCGSDAAGEGWYLIGGVAHRLHETCAQQEQAALESVEQQRREEDDGSYVQGLIGALGGAALGAVVWAFVLLGGYVASLVGLLIGWLAEKGYNLLHGKQGKGKVAILILAIVFGVLLGTLGADVIYLAQMIGNGELIDVTYGDIPGMILGTLIYDAEYRGAILSNSAMGLLFAGLGVFALLRKAGQEVAGVNFKKLR